MSRTVLVICEPAVSIMALGISRAMDGSTSETSRSALPSIMAFCELSLPRRTPLSSSWKDSASMPICGTSTLDPTDFSLMP
eukprot:CAMPEP_0198728596 /NCGR_PEP_ID=MMETSP1475-20131203/10247_1 /TAXON_ID= ORGANISM="Unidentified sp., Strain CCMP1999" /NCGR_SAMPLE_ID=MMETSP1475 /ASSEMBLY_ACC=CAM_ASM_001111 /LENGTH=80 /DNA_ID=CAMNT_0044491007 /DNA_START=363 /DNA_END=605 /DNA_ORIENTATION=-